ncbi:MAG TPA: ABC transporter ATP-binding protein [Allosphingosinicella sp.]|nr:ABC transporter ATP-binding protein [Allosphingosinicella sp.]
MTDPDRKSARELPTLLRNLRALSTVMGPRRRLQLVVTFVLMFMGAFAELVTIGAVLPFLAFAAGGDYAARMPALKSAFDSVGLASSGNAVIPVALVLVAAAIVSAVLRLALTWSTQKFVFGLQHDITVRVYGRIIRQPYELFVRQNSSTALAGIEKVYFVVIGVVSPILSGLTSAGIAAFIIAFLFMIDPVTAAIASLSMGLLYVGITVINRHLVLVISERGASMRTARMKLLQESLGGYRDVILDRSEAVFERRLSEYENENRRLQILANLISNCPRIIVEGAGITLVALLAVYFSWQPGGVLAALPVLGALALGAQRLLPLLQTVYLGWAHPSIHAHNLRDVVALMNSPTSLDRAQARPGSIVPFARSVQLKGLCFAYDDRVRALDDVNLTISKGERVGLVGRTGSGKSTLVDVLMGLLKPTGGQMLIDGIAIDDENRGNWQGQIAHVPQAIFLADDTIAANIAFGSDSAIDDARVWEAAERANIHAFVAGLPEGMMTRVGERGVRLSGGQRQRIGIARALYKKATVLILDEATSALDQQTEAAVMKGIEELDRDLTLLVIAHRVSTIAFCDTVYRLDGGRIVQSGSYGQIVAHG